MRRAIVAITAMTVALLAVFVWSYSKSVVKDYYATGPGEMGPTVLEPGSMTIEVDHQPGFEPNEDALAKFRSQAENYSGRRVDLVVTNVSIPQSSNISIDDVIGYEHTHRNVAPVSGDRVGLYIIYLGGSFKDNPNVLAATYLSLSIVGVKSEIERFAPQPGPCDSIMIVNECKVERSVLIHEFGHVLGLVDLFYTSQRDHHDDQHPGHCTNESCAMYHSIDLYKGGLPKSPNSALDRDCLDDISIIRSSSYGKYYLKDPRFDAVISIIIISECVGVAAVIFWDRRKRKTSAASQAPPLPGTPP